MRVDKIDPSSRVGARVEVRLRAGGGCEDMPHHRAEDGVTGTIVRCGEALGAHPHP